MKPWEPGAVILLDPQAVGDAIRECASEINVLRTDYTLRTLQLAEVNLERREAQAELAEVKRTWLSPETYEELMDERKETLRELAAVTRERDSISEDHAALIKLTDKLTEELGKQQKMYWEKTAQLEDELAACQKDAERMVSWIDGAIEIVELFKPDTASQIVWRKKMVTLGYELIQAHVDRHAAMKGGE